MNENQQNEEALLREIFDLAGVNKKKAKKLIKILTLVKKSAENKDRNDLIKRAIEVPEREFFGGIYVSPEKEQIVRSEEYKTASRRVREILFTLIIGLITNGLYDILKLMLAHTSTFFNAADDDQVKAEMDRCARRFDSIQRSMPEEVVHEVLGSSTYEDVEAIHNAVKQLIRKRTENDSGVVKFFTILYGEDMSAIESEFFSNNLAYLLTDFILFDGKMERIVE